MYFDAPFFVNYSNKFIQILSNVCKIGENWINLQTKLICFSYGNRESSIYIARGFVVCNVLDSQ